MVRGHTVLFFVRFSFAGMVAVDTPYCGLEPRHVTREVPQNVAWCSRNVCKHIRIDGA
jgi:hypothetical protein